jgi:putative tryptophan/tyrosine transport system substrate-binding protein
MTATVQRREFITLLGGAAAGWPLAARAQQFGKIPRVGVLVSLSAPHPFTEAFRSGLRDLGYIEGTNIAIEWRYATHSSAERSSWRRSWSSFQWT